MKAGLPPGTPVYNGKPNEKAIQLRLWIYTPERVLQYTYSDWATCQENLQREGVKWLEIDGVHDVQLIEQICVDLGIHVLTTEDLVNVYQRPKLEEYAQYLHVTMRMFNRVDENAELSAEQLSLILLSNQTVISFQESNGLDILQPIRDRLLLGKGRIRKMQADYLLYALMDTVVDGYFEIMDIIGDNLEKFEDQLLSNPHKAQLNQLYRLKRDVMDIRKAVLPLREITRNLRDEEQDLIGKQIDIFLRDLADHTLRIQDSLETYRELIAALMDLYLSSVSLKLNEIMKVLAVVSSIFIPVTFIAGVYGMNFKNMPELRTDTGYFWTVGVMAFLILGQLFYFKWRKWF